jgi:phage terminase large subunit-like protein
MRDKVRQLYRKDFFSFVAKALRENAINIKNQPYLEIMIAMLKRLISGEAKRRLVINLPPRHLKTWLCTVCFAAYFLARNPEMEVLIVCHDEDLAKQITDTIRGIFRTTWFQIVFPEAIVKSDHSRSGDFRTTRGGGVKAVTINSKHAGRGANLIIFDDVVDVPDWNNEELMEAVTLRVKSMFSRSNNSKRLLALFVAHRLQENDVSARLLATGSWDHLCLPFRAIKRETYDLGYKNCIREKGDILRPDAYDEGDLETLESDHVAPHYDYYYQQGVFENASLVIRRQHFRIFDSFDSSKLHYIISVDPAQKDGEHNSHNVIQAWATDGARHFLIDQWCRRARYKKLKKAFWKFAKRYPASAILIEDTASGSALIDDVSGDLGRWLHPITPKKGRSKIQRLYDVADMIVGRKILLRADAEWTEQYVQEFLLLPRRGSDSVDATTMYLKFMKSNPTLVRPPKRGGIGLALASQPSAAAGEQKYADGRLVSVANGIASARRLAGVNPLSPFPEAVHYADQSGPSDLLAFGNIAVRRYR